MKIDEQEYTFKDSILKLYELLGDANISFEYEEMPGKEVTVDIKDKEDE